MGLDSKDNDGVPARDGRPLPVEKAVAGAPPVETGPTPLEPVAHNNAIGNPQNEPKCDGAVAAAKQIPTSVAENEKLSPFERQSIRVGYVGILVSFLSLMAACAAAYWVCKQFQEMAKQTSLLSRSFEKQKTDSDGASIATAKQLAIMQAQLTQQQDGMRLDQRAWVGIQGKLPPTLRDESGVTVHLVAGSLPKIEVVAVNSGKTPARSFSFRTNFEIRMSKDPVDLIYGPPQEGGSFQKSKAIVQPNQPIGMPIGEGGPAILGPQIDALKSGYTVFYFFGHITYEDVFRRHHETNFCMFLHRDLAGASPCSTYNYAD